MADKFTIPPQVQAIHAVFNRHIRYYPPLTAAFGGNPSCTLVFAELLYQDGLRLARKAAFFTLTDTQLSERCGIGLDQARRARDVICDPGILLFAKERHGSPPLNHYQGQYERIYAWLEINGVGKPPRPPPRGNGDSDTGDASDNDKSNLRETIKSICGKPPNRFAENPHPLKNLINKSNDDDDARIRARAISLEDFFISSNIENPTRNELVSGLSFFADGLEIAKSIHELTTNQTIASQNGTGWMRSSTGLMISRLRAEIRKRQTPAPKR